MYCKPAGYPRVWIVFNNAAFNSGMSQTYNLTGSGSLVGGIAYGGTGSAGSASITLISNGWYRLTLTGIVDATSTGANIFFYIDNGTTNVFVGDGTSGIYMWGAQLEVGAFATSLIPTTTVSTWRWTDALVMPVSAASWFNPNEGSLLSSVTYRDILLPTGAHNSGFAQLDRWRRKPSQCRRQLRNRCCPKHRRNRSFGQSARCSECLQHISWAKSHSAFHQRRIVKERRDIRYLHERDIDGILSDHWTYPVEASIA